MGDAEMEFGETGTVAKFISANLSSCKNFCDSNLDKIPMLQEREFVVLFRSN